MKNIVITGVGSGVGFAIARDLSINNQEIQFLSIPKRPKWNIEIIIIKNIINSY